MASAPIARTVDLGEVPAPVRAVLEALTEQGFPTYLVGGSIRDLLQGISPAEHDAATAAPPDQILRIFPRAVPIGLRHGTVMVPTDAGPVDVTTFRAGPSIEADLAHRDFTVNAMALDLHEAEILDPHEGRSDLARGRLRAVGSARDRFAEDPLRALRAARIFSTLGLRPDAAVEEAMTDACAGLAQVARERIRSELARTLLGLRVAEAIELLRRTGVEAALLPGAAPDAARVVAELPAELEIRLAGWLRGGHPAAVLPRLRFSRPAVRRVDRILRYHPVDDGGNPARDASVRRLLQRVGDDGVEALLVLRDAELRVGDAAARPDADTARTRLDTLRRTLDRLRSAGRLALTRRDLVLDGRDVQEILACAPGPEIGQALSFLAEEVIEHPERNTPEGLRALLVGWSRGRVEPQPGS